MSRNQRQHHSHLRRMATIRARRPYPVSKAKRDRDLEGHNIRTGGGGDGYTEPREEWGYCSCGTGLWHSMQGYGSHTFIEWRDHLRAAKHQRKPLLHKGGKP